MLLTPSHSRARSTDPTSTDAVQALAAVLGAPRAGEALSLEGLSEQLGRYTGRVAEGWVEPMTRLHGHLLEGGVLLGTEGLKLEGGLTLHAAPLLRTAAPTTLASRLGARLAVLMPGPAPELRPATREARVLVLRTAQLRFILVLNRTGRQAGLHLRRFWDPMDETLAAGRHPPLLANLELAELSLQDALRLSATLCESFADDIPGVELPRRLSLPSILAHSLFVGERDASAALRWGDDRDAGYLLSMEAAAPGEGHVPDVLSGGMPYASFAMTALLQAAASLPAG